MSLPRIICLMGPTASGKTPLAVKLVQHFPFEIISVDSAMVYRGMDIGTAKPEPEVLQLAPHRLIDLLDPKEAYSAGQFCHDALKEITTIHASGKIPLLVGGTMLYFRTLQQGMAQLPTADATLRAELQTRGNKEGWEALHAELMQVDPPAAKRINPSDSQRIQRALEVYLLTGKKISEWQHENTQPLLGYQIQNLALAPAQRSQLHERIALRFEQMMAQGFEAEVQRLFARDDLHPDLPSIRSVGYRQMWSYLEGTVTQQEMCEQVLAATRQLAKRQLTWLRPWPELTWFDTEDKALFDKVAKELASYGIK